MKIRPFLVTILALLFLFAGTQLYADILHMFDGSTIEGTIVEEDDLNVKIRVTEGNTSIVITVAKSKIMRIEYGKTNDDKKEDKKEDEKKPKEETPKPEGTAKRHQDGISHAKEACEKYTNEEFDPFLKLLTTTMMDVVDDDDFKEVYKIIEDFTGKNIPTLLEAEMKRPCSRVMHVKPFYVACKVCKGAGKTTKTVDGKKRKIKCSTCNGKGMVECSHCASRVDLATKFRKKVRYTKDEMNHVVFIKIYRKDVSDKIFKKIFKTITSGTKVFIIDEKDTYTKCELTLKKGDVNDFQNRMQEEGISLTPSETEYGLYTIRIKL